MQHISKRPYCKKMRVSIWLIWIEFCPFVTQSTIEHRTRVFANRLPHCLSILRQSRMVGGPHSERSHLCWLIDPILYQHRLWGKDSRQRWCLCAGLMCAVDQHSYSTRTGSRVWVIFYPTREVSANISVDMFWLKHVDHPAGYKFGNFSGCLTSQQNVEWLHVRRQTTLCWQEHCMYRD